MGRIRMGMRNGQIMPDQFTKHSLGNGAVWLVPKIYSTQNTAVMFVQYISPFMLDILEIV